MDDAELGRLLNQSSRENVIKKLREIIETNSPHLINDTHPCYLKKSILNSQVSEDELATYISSLSLFHCLDAWKYIGHSFQAMDRGDSAAACHLAYYAELRATISILASQGIGVFENHFTILKSDGSSEHVPMGRGTHQIAWTLLNRLCDDTDFKEILPRIISVEGYDLSEFLTEFGYSSSSSATFWSLNLGKWGIDLKLMYEEQQRRNIASYYPNSFIQKHYSLFKDVIQFSSNIWRLLEYSNRNFTNLDRALFKKTLEELKTSKEWNEDDYIGELDRVLKIKDIPENSSFFVYLHSNIIPDILKYASKDDPQFFSGFEFCMISRAILLSRISLGAVKLLLDDSSPQIDANIILADYGIQHGIIDTPDEIGTDLYADVIEAMIMADKWCTGNTKITPNNWNVYSKENANIITSFERIPIWCLSR